MIDPKRIKNSGEALAPVTNTGASLPRIPPEDVAKALGADLTPSAPLASLEALDAAATPGPWTQHSMGVRAPEGAWSKPYEDGSRSRDVANCWGLIEGGDEKGRADAALIVALRNDALPLLRALESANRALRDQVARLTSEAEAHHNVNVAPFLRDALVKGLEGEVGVLRERVERAERERDEAKKTIVAWSQQFYAEEARAKRAEAALATLTVERDSALARIPPLCNKLDAVLDALRSMSFGVAHVGPSDLAGGVRALGARCADAEAKVVLGVLALRKIAALKDQTIFCSEAGAHDRYQNPARAYMAGAHDANNEAARIAEDALRAAVERAKNGAKS